MLCCRLFRIFFSVSFGGFRFRSKMFFNLLSFWHSSLNIKCTFHFYLFIALGVICSRDLSMPQHKLHATNTFVRLIFKWTDRAITASNLKIGHGDFGSFFFFGARHWRIFTDLWKFFLSFVLFAVCTHSVWPYVASCSLAPPLPRTILMPINSIRIYSK